MKENMSPQTAIAALSPRSLGYLTGYLQSLVRGRLWLQVLVGMGLGIVTGVVLGPGTGWASGLRCRSS